MSSLADNLLNAHSSGSSEEPAPTQARRVVDLASLPQLKNSAGSGSSGSAGSGTQNGTLNGVSYANGSGSSLSTSRTSAKSSSGQAAHPQIANTGVANITTTLVVPDSEQTKAAVESVIQDFGVNIAIAKSATPNHATFMIKGAVKQIEKAKLQLEEALQPRVRVVVEVPQNARSAVIGARGSNLRSIEQRHRVKLDIQKPSASTWSLEKVPVVIFGGESGAKAASKDVLDAVDEQRQVTSVKKFPAEFPNFSELVFGSAKGSVHGTWSQVLAEMAAVDAQIAQIERNYVRAEVPTGGIKVPTDLLLAQRTLVSRPHDGSVTIFAPSDKAQAVQKQLEEYIQSQTTSDLDISRAHGGDMAHARVLARYLAAVDVAEQLARQYTVHISADNLVFTISGAKSNVQQARKELVRRVNELSPATLGVVRGMRHALVRKIAQDTLSKTDLGSVKATIGPSDELYLVYEDSGDDFAPSEQQVRDSVANAHRKLQFLTDMASMLARKNVALSPADAAFAVKPVGREAQALRKEFDVEIAERTVGSSDASSSTASAAGDDEDEDLAGGVTIIGTKDNVEKAIEALPKIIQLSRTHSIRMSHIEEFQVDAELVKQIVGRQGQQISQFRKEFGVKMDVDKNGKVVVQGIEGDAKQCVKAVLDFQRRLRDESVQELDIPNEYHSRLIGPKGKYVNRLREKHNCIIRFPGEQGSSIILVRGPSKGVNAVKREFLELVEYEKQQSYFETLKLPPAVVPRIVGKGGLVVNSIKAETGAQIDIGNAPAGSEGDANGASDAEIEVKVIGEKKKVAEAMRRIKEAAAVVSDITEINLTVEPQYWRRLVLERPELVAKAGGEEDNASRLLTVPSQNSSPDTPVRILGPSKVASQLDADVKQLLSDLKRKSTVSGELNVPANRLRRVAGTMGSVRREAETKYDVLVDVPTTSNSNSTKLAAVSVKGETQKAVDEAIAHLRSIALPESTSMKVVVNSWNSIRRSVQDKFGVRTHVNGSSKLPPPPQDEEAPVELISITPDATLEIEGETEEKCKEVVEYVSERTPTTLAYVFIPQSKIGQVIGPGGKAIRATRQKTGCTIDVPSAGAATLLGKKAEVEAAIEALTK